MSRIRTRRAVLGSLIATGAGLSVLPKRWSAPIVSSIILPAHAQTSAQCSGFDTEPIDQPIDIEIAATEVRGPIVVALQASGEFSGEQTLATGSCSNGSPFTQRVTFSGRIDSATSQITGDLVILQFCGDDLACEQISTYTATQMPIDASSDLGAYQGRVTGTITCCRDFD